ncbi:transposase DNA-binding-containing protein [Mesorhizobium silamurunense]|uniref:transposase DNA-binding-containing protein n=1 Tax=Mesorhizobium silamurunense TaxID=499528 RepID=UPI0024839023|nr:transposase DNA-binding-containing protein [Mesorhizobium silamurunense]
MEGTADAWFDRELSECRFADERLSKRLRQLVELHGGRHGSQHSAGVPGLGQHQGWLSFLFE